MTGDASSRPHKLTIRTVAEDAGVSVAAVSKVLRNAYGVSDALRAKVTASIDKLGYRPSTAARGMRGRTYTVGVLLVELGNTFLPQVIEGIKPTLSEANYHVLIGVGEAKEVIEVSLIESMMDMRLDGLILIAPRLSGGLLARYARDIPMVVIGHHEATAQSFDTVNSDDHDGARLAVEALIARGCRDIHMTTTPGNNHAPHDVQEMRSQGFMDAMRQAGRESKGHIHALREQPWKIGPPVDNLFARDPMPDGLFCWSDIHGIQMLNRAAELGIAVPERMALIGYDNTPTAALPLVGLSSIDQDPRKMGHTAAEMLLSRIDGRTTPEHVLVEPELVQRRSSVECHRS